MAIGWAALPSSSAGFVRKKPQVHPARRGRAVGRGRDAVERSKCRNSVLCPVQRFHKSDPHIQPGRDSQQAELVGGAEGQGFGVMAGHRSPNQGGSSHGTCRAAPGTLTAPRFARCCTSCRPLCCLRPARLSIHSSEDLQTAGHIDDLLTATSPTGPLR